MFSRLVWGPGYLIIAVMVLIGHDQKGILPRPHLQGEKKKDEEGEKKAGGRSQVPLDKDDDCNGVPVFQSMIHAYDITAAKPYVAHTVQCNCCNHVASMLQN